MASIADSPFQSVRTENLVGPQGGRCLYLIQSALPRKARFTSYKYGGQRGGKISEKRMEGWTWSTGHNVYRGLVRRKHLVSSLFSGRFHKFSLILHLGIIRQRHSSRQEQPKKNSVFPPGVDKPSMSFWFKRPRAAQREDTAMQYKLHAGSEVWGGGWESGIIMIIFKLWTHL